MLLPSQQPLTPIIAPTANVFYYGKEFGSQPLKVSEEGLLRQKDYRPLSVVQPGAELPQPEKESPIESLLGVEQNQPSLQDLINMLRGG